MKIDCPSWRDVGMANVGRCVLNKFGGRPSHGTCVRCLGMAEQTMATPPVKQSMNDRPLPVLLSEAQRKAVASRKVICETCDYAKRIHHYSVHCQHCGCAGLSLIRGKCPMQKWAGEEADVTTPVQNS